MDFEYLSFPHKQCQLNWANVLWSKFGIFKGFNIWMSVTQTGPFNVSVSDGLLCEDQYLHILDDIVLPYLVRNKNMTYLQELNEVTTSEIVRSWFEMHPEVKCVTWPANSEVLSLMSLPWANIKKLVNDNFPLSCREAKKLVSNFWKSLQETPEYFNNSFTTIQISLEKVKEEHLAFARDHADLDWKKVLFSKFDAVRSVSVWAAGSQFGPFKIGISDGLPSETRYIQILDDIVLPFLMENKTVTYVQESSAITKSEVVRSWFHNRPVIKCITWPPITSPMSRAWDDMNKYVDDNFPLTSSEIRGFVLKFWGNIKRDRLNYYLDSFKRCIANVAK